jgi:hypothetical protein
MWRCDSPIWLSEATSFQSTQLDGRSVVGHMLEATFEIGHWFAVCSEPGESTNTR